jgi:hypothetical protein
MAQEKPTLEELLSGPTPPDDVGFWRRPITPQTWFMTAAPTNFHMLRLLFVLFLVGFVCGWLFGAVTGLR